MKKYSHENARAKAVRVAAQHALARVFMLVFVSMCAYMY